MQIFDVYGKYFLQGENQMASIDILTKWGYNLKMHNNGYVCHFDGRFG